MKKILLASDNSNFSRPFIQFLSSMQFDYEGFEIMHVSNFEDLLYNLFFENFDADILFMNFNDSQIDFNYLSLFEKDLQSSINEIMKTSSCTQSAIGKICQYLASVKYDKQLDVVYFDVFENLNKFSDNDTWAIDLNSPDILSDIINTLDLIQEKGLK